MRTSLGIGANPFSKEAIDSLCALAVRGLAVTEVAAHPPEWFWVKDGHMPEDGAECLIWHVLGDSSRSAHAIDIATWLKGEWIFPWDRPKLNNTPQWVRAWRPQVAPPSSQSYAESPLGHIKNEKSDQDFLRREPQGGADK